MYDHLQLIQFTQMHKPNNNQMEEPQCSSIPANSSASGEKENPLTQPFPPPMPERLPSSIEAIIRPSPENARAAVSMSVFSALRALMKEVEFLYIDNSWTEPAFMSILIAEHASGKSAIRPPLNAILCVVARQDEAARIEDQQWRDKCATLGANKQHPPAPTSPIRCIQPDCTNPALVRLAKRASPYTLFSYGEEIEKLFRMKNVSEIIRSAYDSELFGQERVGAQSVSEVVRLRWSFCFSTTPPMALKMLRNDIMNGTLSRLTLSTIIFPDDDWGEVTPHHGSYDIQYQESIRAYTYHLEQAHGQIVCPEAIEWTTKKKLEMINVLRLMDAKWMLPFLWRSLQMAFWRSCMLFLMHQQRWSQEIEDFCSWTLQDDLWCKLYYFGSLMEQLAGNNAIEKRRPNMLLPLLPDEFSKEQAREMRQQQGKDCCSKSVRNMLSQWSYRGFIRYDPERNLYIKNKEL